MGKLNLKVMIESSWVDLLLKVEVNVGYGRLINRFGFGFFLFQEQIILIFKFQVFLLESLNLLSVRQNVRLSG